MNNYSRLIYVIAVLLLMSCKEKSGTKKAETTQVEATEKWISLFNGKDIDNWIVKIKGHPAGDNYKNTFIAKDNCLKVNYDEYGDTFNSTFGHIYYNMPFSNYKLRLQYPFYRKAVK